METGDGYIHMDLNATAYSDLKIFRHPKKLEALRRKEVTAPLYIRIKPTNRCNHRCYYCSYADKELSLREKVNLHDSIPWEKLREVINDLGEMKVKAVTFSGGGEPLVYPHIVEAMKLVLDNKINLSVITNGQNLSSEIAEVLTKAHWVRISMDSCDATTYSEIRRIPEKNFIIVSDNIKIFAQKKLPDCELGINYVINHENANSIYQMAKYVKELGVNHIKYTARITRNLHSYHDKFKASAIEQIQRASHDFSTGSFKVINKYEDDFVLCAVFNRNYSKCPIMQIITVIGADSKVYLCHDKAYVPGGELGDLKNQTFKNLWFSEETKNRFESFDAQKECQHHCVYDQRNIMINSYLSLKEQHINFI